MELMSDELEAMNHRRGWKMFLKITVMREATLVASRARVCLKEVARGVLRS
jgi:hypothetical protein